MNGFRRTFAVCAIATLVISAVIAADLNEELMDSAKQFAYYPAAILNGVGTFLHELRPPVSRRMGLRAKTDSSSCFKDYEVAAR